MGIIEEIEILEDLRVRGGLASVSRPRKNLVITGKTKLPGFYWVHSDYSVTDLILCGAPRSAAKVPVSSIVAYQHDLHRMIKQTGDSSWIVYNGVASSISSRIGSHVRSINHRTGSIDIEFYTGTLADFTKWRFSWVTVSDFERELKIKGLPPSHPDLFNLPWKKRFAEPYERAWRLHYGWPTLCRK